MIAETVKIRNATIRVHDDSFVGKNKDEIQSAIEEYCRCVIDALQRQDKNA